MWLQPPRTNAMTEMTHFNRSPSLARPLPVGGVVLVSLSIVVSALSYNALPASVRIRWHVGGTYYGPEYAPALAVVVGFPVVLGILLAGSHWLETYFKEFDEVDTIRPVYEWCVLLTLTTIVLVQLVIVALNLYL